MIPVRTREHGIDARTFSGTSHVFSPIYGHAAHALSLNGICDALSVHGAEFLRVRGATAPKRNTFSNANRTRDPAMAEALYWAMLAHLQGGCPGFTEYGKHAGFIFRLKREIFAMDSATLQLTLASIDWARHRRRKATAKCHMRLNVGSFLPAFAVVEDAAHHDSARASARGTCCWPTAPTGPALPAPLYGMLANKNQRCNGVKIRIAALGSVPTSFFQYLA